MRPVVVLQATIATLAPGGDGVTHADIDGRRRAIFVPRSAPGDVAKLEVDAAQSPARGRLVALIAPGPARVLAPCPWVEPCGGCDWMHLSPQARLAAHVELVRAALPEPWRVTPIAGHAVDPDLGYRTRARVHVHCDRQGNATAGMYTAGTHKPVAVEVCAVLDPRIESGRRLLPSLFAGSAGRGEVHVALGADRAPVLDVRWNGSVAAEAFGRIEAAVRQGRLAGADVTLSGASRPARIGDPSPWMTGADASPLRLAPGGFGQASEAGNRSLGRHVADLVRPLGCDKTVELYSGAGNLSVLLAHGAPDSGPAELTCVESDGPSCAAARENLASRGLSARVVEADAAEYRFPSSTKLVVLDPPRTGARPVVERLAASRVPNVVYVSCQPQTLGRDLALLEPSYEPTSVAVFEMFPQTSHVEVVVSLRRRRP